MASQYPQLTRHDLEAKIVKHSWEDEGFRKEFIADPAHTFVKYLNVPAASLPKISVHQEEPGSWHIVLPAKPENTNELSDAELETVAGGGLGVSGARQSLIWDPRVLQGIGFVRDSVSGKGGTAISAVRLPLGSEGW
jgi:hypothetical protein